MAPFNPMPTHPTALLAYSWDGKTYKTGVRELATGLRADDSKFN